MQYDFILKHVSAFLDNLFWFRPEWINTEFKLLLHFYSSNQKFTFKTQSLGKKEQIQNSEQLHTQQEFMILFTAIVSKRSYIITAGFAKLKWFG